jgi:phosphoglycolate phosphatase
LDVKGILFDKDGTLFDFDATWGQWCRRFLRDLAGDDKALSARLAGAVGFVPETGGFLPDSPVLAETPRTIAGHLLPHLTGWNAETLITHMNALALSAPQVQMVPLAPLLTALGARGLALGVATNDSEGPARAHLAAAGVLGLFDQVIGFDSGFGGKPEPGPLLAFARRARLMPAQVAMVGDSPHDMVAARAAGMIAVGVGGSTRDLQRLSVLADVILPDIAALPDWIDANR